MKKTRREFSKTIGALCIGFPFLGAVSFDSKGSCVNIKVKLIRDKLYYDLGDLSSDINKIDLSSVIKKISEARIKIGNIEGKNVWTLSNEMKVEKHYLIKLLVNITKHFKGLSNINGVHAYFLRKERMERTRDIFVFFMTGPNHPIGSVLFTEGKFVFLPTLDNNSDKIIDAIDLFLNKPSHKISKFKIHIFIKSDGIVLTIVDDVPESEIS